MYRFDPKNINDDFDDNEPDLFEDYPLDDEDENEFENDCFFCAGTGEGASPDLRCNYCKGTGTIKKRKY